MRLIFTGSNGNNYLFLLKGHEDLRQDERVMQLFGLVNTLLMNDPKTFRHNLTIQVGKLRTPIILAITSKIVANALKMMYFYCAEIRCDTIIY